MNREHHAQLCVFFFNDTATTEIYTLSLHDALPISVVQNGENFTCLSILCSYCWLCDTVLTKDRKSTRLNSSHANISYAVFCLKKKKVNQLAPFLLAAILHRLLSHSV